MGHRKRSSLVFLLLLMIGLMTTAHLCERALAAAGDLVQMSPGTFAHFLGNSTDMVKLDYPKSSVLQNATGDISLQIRLSGNRSSIAIYIPPEFTFLQPDTTSVWTNVTNDYRFITMSRLSSTDPIGPSWWRIRIATNGTIPWKVVLPGGVVWNVSYSVRLFNVRAPDVCGRYFVKIFTSGTSIGAKNFPTIVVKGGLDPAYISGHVLNGEYGKYSTPLSVPGKVIAEGKTAQGTSVKAQAYFNASASGNYTLYGLAAGTYRLTASAAGFAPSTKDETVTVYPGQSLEAIDLYVLPSATISGTIFSKCAPGLVPWGNVSWNVPRSISIEISDHSGGQIAVITSRTNSSLTFHSFSFNGTIELDGHVPQDGAAFVSGLESGDYYLRVRVNGYLQKGVVSVHVHDYTQSVSLIVDMWRSAVFEVTVAFRDWENGSLGPTPWNGTLTVGAYELDGTFRGSNNTFVSKGNLTRTVVVAGTGDGGLPPGTYIILASFQGYLQPKFVHASLGEGCSATSLSLDLVRAGALNLTLRSANWQTPPGQVLWTYPNATIRLEIVGSTGRVYSATAKQLKGLAVSTANITGLPADIYVVRAYTVGYLQTKDYPVSVTLGSQSDITLILLIATRMDITLTFRTEARAAPIDAYHYTLVKVPARIEVYDHLGVLTGANTTYIPAGALDHTVEVIGFRSYAGNPCVRWVNYYDTTDGRSQRDYGLPPGTYQVLVWVPGYVQAEMTSVSTTPGVCVIADAPQACFAGVTFTLDKLARVYGNVRGFNMFGDLIPLSWATVTAYGPTLEATSSLDGFYEMWTVDGTYLLGVSHPGYETQGVEIRASMAWEIPADFDLRRPSGTIPELPTAELMLPIVLFLVCAKFYRKKSPATSV